MTDGTTMAHTTASDLLLLPNILSLSRMLLTPLVGYFLWRNDPISSAACVALLVLAALTDALDGYVARRQHHVTQLGLVLDPLADKVFAAALLVELVLFRDLPIWLAAVIVGRDVLILVAGLIVLRRRKISLPSNLTGQYAFFAIVLLIGCYVIRFETGAKIIAIFALSLVGLSLLHYARAFWAVLQEKPIPAFSDRPLYRALRVGATAVVLAICLIIFIFQLK